jgi:ssDNA-binding Zn-finger/Zn-ribbon topoisomerase 1
VKRPAERLVGCPLCPSRARLTHGRRGWFYSCARFPACRGAKPVAPPVDGPMVPGDSGRCSTCGGRVDATSGERFADGGRTYYRHCAGSEACAGAVTAAAGRMPL